MASEVDEFVQYIKLRAGCYKALLQAYTDAKLFSATLEAALDILKKVEKELKKESEEEGRDKVDKKL